MTQCWSTCPACWGPWVLSSGEAGMAERGGRHTALNFSTEGQVQQEIWDHFLSPG